MPDDRDGTQFFLLQKLMRSLLWCIYAFPYYLIKLHQLVASRTIQPPSITSRDLEHMLCDETAEPKPLPLSLLKEITDGFSDEQRIGIGGFAVVYKGKVQNRIVAIKRMSNDCMDEKLFHREVQCLMIAKHKNIVRFLGYCADRQGIMKKYEEKFVMADIHQRLLCFEYLPNGSLRGYITDTSHEPRWRDCYKIITGICQGLHYLHQKKIAHLDLKPENVLLDDNLVAKIADFGLSRCFIGETESRVISKIGGTLGYWAPETVGNHTQVTNRDLCRLDIYSLGVVILEILTGKNCYLVIMEIHNGKKEYYHHVDNVVESWSNLVEQSQRDELLEQVRVCAEIGIECINVDPTKRPDTKRITNKLDGTETMDEYIKTGLVTSQQAENAPNEQHQDMPDSPGETSSKENVPAVTVAGTKTSTSIWDNTANLGKFNETMNTLNPDTRRCFEFCSIFPRGSKLRRHDLVRLWITQGFVKTICAVEDMEDIAGGYIQELVSISFLEPIGTSSDTDCFRVHDALHDILDKVDAKCFRIENARSNRGEVWEGVVPRETQHLLIQHYDGELITETIIGLENLRTLIVYAVGQDTTIEENVIESVCKRLPKLWVLAFAFSQEHDPIEQPKEFSFPESVGQLEYLRYLAFRANYDCKITLPSTVNKLHHIQLLDFGEGKIAGFTFAELVNLRHIFCSPDVNLAYVGRLRSLQTLRGFTVSNEQGCDLKQLRDLANLRGDLCIFGLGNVKSKAQALQANLAAKRLTELRLSFGYGDKRCSPEVEEAVLEGLCPPVGLKSLVLWNFAGWRYPDWMVGKHSVGSKYLQELCLFECSQPVPASGLAEAFPHLRVLKLWHCRWNAVPEDMDHLTSLKELEIGGCKNIRSLPSLPKSLEVIRLFDCNDELTESCETVGDPNWQKIDKLNETMHSLNPDIKRCFEFCSIFPRGSKLRRDDLVRLWIALGYVKTSCATEDMEERARSYIQDLVSISFLEATGTTDCFTVHDALHDILDKVNAKCFRIENARSNRGEVWEGVVPRETQHLLIQHYDGELITETIIGLEYLRTLIVYIVEEDTRVEEKVIESICNRLPKLRVLAIAFSQEHDPIKQPKEFSFPESVGQLEYLRYLAFRANYHCNITLPSTINKLHHIQLLDFGEGEIAGFTFAELVNLRHIFCWGDVNLAYVGRLRSLQTLPGFTVSNEQGCDLKQLRDLVNLRGKLCIGGLENVKSKAQALQANLAAKGLTGLELSFCYGDKRCSPEVEADVLEGLCPPVGLKCLELYGLAGWRYPDWMVGKHSAGPKYLQELGLFDCSQPVPASVLAEAFPHLRVLELLFCGWNALPEDMDHLKSLKKLRIRGCNNIRSLTSLPQSLEVFQLCDCNDELEKSCKTVGDPNWQKIEHIPMKHFW